MRRGKGGGRRKNRLLLSSAPSLFLSSAFRLLLCLGMAVRPATGDEAEAAAAEARLRCGKQKEGGRGLEIVAESEKRQGTVVKKMREIASDYI